MDDLRSVNAACEPLNDLPRGKFGLVGMAAISILMLCTLHLLAATVSISTFDLEGEPDQRLVNELVLLNTDSTSARFEIAIVDWQKDQDGVTRTFEPGTLDRSCASWIALSASEATVATGQESAISFAIDVAHDARGTHWAGLLITVHALDGASEDGTIGLVRQFLVRIFVTAGPRVREGTVSGVRVQGVNPLGVEVTFENVGDTLLSGVTGLVVIESEWGAPLMEMDLESFDVLPGHSSVHVAQADWGVRESGLYLIRGVFDFGAEYLVAGQTVLRLRPLDLGPIGESSHLPQDLDGNGLYEDIDGDGVLSLADVELLRLSIDEVGVQSNGRAFDYDNDGVVTQMDVDTLLETVLRWGD